MTYNIKLMLEYDGTNYHGWQRQANLPTIQGALEEALSRINKHPVKVTGAGRTDAGVHATGQAANFKSNLHIRESSWVKAINSLLPDDIMVRKTWCVPSEFHARYSARSKVYQFIILNSEHRSPFLRNYAWHIRQHLDIPAMQKASGYLTGTHDYSSFRASDCSAKSPLRTLDRLEIREISTADDLCLPYPVKLQRHITLSTPEQRTIPAEQGIPDNEQEIIILFTFEARAYLQHMVRNIVGTLADVGRGKLTPSDVPGILEKKDRRSAGQIAQSQGLFLSVVRY